MGKKHFTHSQAQKAPLWRRIELPTWIVVAATYGGWLLLTWNYGRLPVWLVLPMAAALMTLHGSIQHEAIHGHPTRSRSLNSWIAGVPLSLWLPYRIYRESHLLHHRDDRLTDPLEDPESYYVTSSMWQRMGPLPRAIRFTQTTLLGRVLLGPLLAMTQFFRVEWRLLRSGERRHLGAWLRHIAGCVPVLVWVVAICGIPLWAYIAVFVYPGLSLTLVRSFPEHRPAESPEERSVIVEADPVMSLLFLNNNLHAVHHDNPGLPWYELPARYRRDRDAVLSTNGRFLYHGYSEVIRLYALRVKDPPVHPRA